MDGFVLFPGGGFGGKGTDSVWAAAIAALGAHK